MRRPEAGGRGIEFVSRPFPRLAAALIVVALALASTGWSPQAIEDAAVDVQLLAFNDFHGWLPPPPGSDGRIGTTEAGGIEFLASHLARLKAGNPNTVVVSAGDNIGASPLISSMFHDEPTVEALSDAGLQFSAVGNHELDEGWAELFRMQKGGCHPVDGCRAGTGFKGAAFQYLSANILFNPRRVDAALLASSGWTPGRDRPETLFPPFAVKEVGGVKLGFIGLTLRRAPDLVLAPGVRGLTFEPEAKSANAAARTLRRQGVRAIVVLIHEGARPAAGGDTGSCPGLTGDVLKIVAALSHDIDVVVSGHTHRAYVCSIGPTLLTSADRYGHAITAIDLRIDRLTGEVRSKTARNVIVTRDIAAAPKAAALLGTYRDLVASVSLRPVGTLAASISRTGNASGESALGDLVADSMLAATASPAAGGAVIALMNPGGIRENLVHEAGPGRAGPVPITYSDAFSVLPFNNLLVVKTLNGEALRRLLEQQFDNPRPGARTILQVSRNFSYAYDQSRSIGRRVDPSSIAIAGRRVDPRGRYRIVMPDFLWSGGDRFGVAVAGSDPVLAIKDIDAFIAYLTAHSPIAPGELSRITRTD